MNSTEYAQIFLKYRFVYFQEPILAKTFHRKVQSKKIFIHRENFDAIIANTEEQLAQVWYTIQFIHNHQTDVIQMLFGLI